MNKMIEKIKEMRADLMALEVKVLSQGRFPAPEPGFILDDFLQEVRNHYYSTALHMSGGNKTNAGKLLGVSCAAVAKWQKTYGE